MGSWGGIFSGSMVSDTSSMVPGDTVGATLLTWPDLHTQILRCNNTYVCVQGTGSCAYIPTSPGPLLPEPSTTTFPPIVKRVVDASRNQRNMIIILVLAKIEGILKKQKRETLQS